LGATTRYHPPPMPRLSQHTAFLKQSEIRNMTLECVRVGGLNLSQGVCDTPVPEAVLRGAQAALASGANTYTRYDGIPELRQAIARKLESQRGLRYEAEGELVVTSGSSAAFYGACRAVLDTDDEVVLFEPFYGYHLDTLRALGVRARFVTLEPPEWGFDEASLRAALTSRTRAIVINTPTNPSGKVFTDAELALVGRIAEDHDLFVLTDEIYEHFVYDGRTHRSPAAVPGLRPRTITIGGFSKTLSITGWRLGFSAAPRPIAERLGFINDLVYICAPAPLQAGVATALGELDDAFYAGLARDHQRKRDRICAALDGAGITPHVPQGAYYVLADTSRIAGKSSKDRVMTLLEKTGIAAVPGTAFYHAEGGDNLARFCFAKTDEALDDACRRLDAFRP
jgi:aminotransferase